MTRKERDREILRRLGTRDVKRSLRVKRLRLFQKLNGQNWFKDRFIERRSARILASKALISKETKSKIYKDIESYKRKKAPKLLVLPALVGSVSAQFLLFFILSINSDWLRSSLAAENFLAGSFLSIYGPPIVIYALFPGKTIDVPLICRLFIPGWISLGLLALLRVDISKVILAGHLGKWQNSRCLIFIERNISLNNLTWFSCGTTFFFTVFLFSYLSVLAYRILTPDQYESFTFRRLLLLNVDLQEEDIFDSEVQRQSVSGNLKSVAFFLRRMAFHSGKATPASVNLLMIAAGCNERANWALVPIETTRSDLLNYSSLLLDKGMSGNWGCIPAGIPTVDLTLKERSMKWIRDFLVMMGPAITVFLLESSGFLSKSTDGPIRSGCVLWIFLNILRVADPGLKETLASAKDIPWLSVGKSKE